MSLFSLLLLYSSVRLGVCRGHLLSSSLQLGDFGSCSSHRPEYCSFLLRRGDASPGPSCVSMAVSRDRCQAAWRGLSLLLHQDLLLGTQSRRSCLGKGQNPVLPQEASACFIAQENVFFFPLEISIYRLFFPKPLCVCVCRTAGPSPGAGGSG